MSKQEQANAPPDGQPAPSPGQYGAPPPGQQGGPPPGQYGGPPPGQYGGPPPGQYGGPPPGQYGGPPPGQYGGPPPGQYGGPPPGQYGAPPGQYGQQPPGYGQPQQPYYGQPGGPVQPVPGQQQQVAWMARPEPVPGCPPGLEYLTQIDQLLVQQQMEMLELFTNFETNNKYKICNTLGQQVYFAAEDTDACMRQCCGPQRGFTIHITDNGGQEVIRVIREFKCCAGMPCCACSDGCALEVQVEAPPGQVVGYVRQEQSCMEPNFTIKDANQDAMLRIKGPVCMIQGPCCTQDQEFMVLAKDSDDQVGKISKQWTGYVREMFTNADNFGISFPQDLNVNIKAVMLGAVFLIDFMFFEQQQNNSNRH